MKSRTWHRLLAFVLSLVLLTLACNLSAHAYQLPAGYTLSNSYKSGKYYTQLSAVTLTGDQRKDIVAIAKSQIGYHEGSKGVFSGYGTGTGNYTEYNRYAYTSDNAAWCGSFVSWCAAMAGIPTSILPKTAAAKPTYWKMCGSNTLSGATAKTPYDLPINGGTYIPQIGDLVFFGSKTTTQATNNSCSHVGLISDVSVTYKSGKVTEIKLTTIEGNYSSKVSQNTYTFNADNKFGHAYGSTYLNTFGVPNYHTKVASTAYPTIDIGAYGGSYLRTTTAVCDAVRVLQQALNLVNVLDEDFNASLLSVDGAFGSGTDLAVKQYQAYMGLEVDGIVGSGTWETLRSHLKTLTLTYKNDCIISDGKLYAYKGNDKTVMVPAGVSAIAEDALRYRTGITTVKLPSSLQKVGSGAFKKCTSLQDVHYEGSKMFFGGVSVATGNAPLTSAKFQFSEVVITFTVENITKTVTAKAGQAVQLPQGLATEKQGNAYCTYTFLGWRLGDTVYKTIPAMTEDAAFVAEYQKNDRILNVETLNQLLVALAHGSDEVTLHDFTEDGVLNVSDLNKLLIILATAK